ncbi:hypothetical protein E3J79_01135 [Candidatus Dependentiae bacterium]|nr:MAG: hypothetical protein E3J79_01135 [Candidatus Dependentiae bacterium]
MRKWFVFHVLLCIAGISQAMDKSNKYLIKLPSAQVLMQRLQKAGFSDFLEKTNKIEELGGQLKSPWRVFLTVEIALYQAYEQDFYDYKGATEMKRKKLAITHLILQDFPEAIERLFQI